MNIPSISFERICKLLDYIHNHLDQPLTLDELAQQSCWSRWQLQRVFQSKTGLTVANYVRELKLSTAAETLLADSSRVIDIAVSLGFNSEISFSRAFKQHFGVSPRDYRKQGRRIGLRKPFHRSDGSLVNEHRSQLIEVKVESADSFAVYGVSGTIQGLFSETPDFSYRVPQLWQQFYQSFSSVQQQALVGVIDVTGTKLNGHVLPYLAGTLHPLVGAKQLIIPAQTYAVVKHKGPVIHLANTLEWFIFHWLPYSSYRSVDGIELERYPIGYRGDHAEAEMEYWLPIEVI